MEEALLVNQESNQRLTKKPARNVNIEILRVISMIMIVALHYLLQGGVLKASSVSGGGCLLFSLDN